MINVSQTAASKITELLTEESKEGSGLRVFVQGGGCSGFQYGLMIEDNGSDADHDWDSNLSVMLTSESSNALNPLELTGNIVKFYIEQLAPLLLNQK